MLLLLLPAFAGPPASCQLVVAAADASVTLQRVGLADGARTALRTLEGIDVGGSRGVVVSGESVLLCAAGELVVAGSGDARSLGAPCAAVGGGSSIVVTDPRGGPAALHRDFAAVAAAETPEREGHLHRLGAVAATDDAVVVASMPGAALHWTVPESGEVERTVVPEGAIGPIWGLSIVGDTLLLLDDGRHEDTVRGPTLRWYDLAEMTSLGSVALTLEPGEVARGLDCAP